MSQSQKKQTQNVKVFIRIRPLLQAESERNVKNIIHNITQKEFIVKEKKYCFDTIFKQESSQFDVYLKAVAPMISDVIEGYNCTVFAYGQTGTGKTYTMIGGNPETNNSDESHWTTDPTAGFIPRAAANIFDNINKIYDSNKQCTVRVSFLELYNEEVRDLLGDDDKLPALNLYNDPSQKGLVLIQGLKEVTVTNRSGIIQLLEKGNRKRQVAQTLMNHNSSRSHTVFTIIVHTLEQLVNGENVLKTGKLNLVDLAGSENIAKSGATEQRAVESANINKSLLTLGRVIKTLIEKKNSNAHVPYRDSKLTRILQDSLGGKSKTCIIATVSPCSTSYEETINTLEYANRAKNITNCPQVNEKTTKTRMIKELNDELDRLRKDLQAARSANGFYIDHENYQHMMEDLESKNHTLKRFETRIKELEVIRDNKIKEWNELHTSFEQMKYELSGVKAGFRKSKSAWNKLAEEFTQNEEILHKKVEKLYNVSSKNENIFIENLTKIKGSIQDIGVKGGLHSEKEIEALEQLKEKSKKHLDSLLSCAGDNIAEISEKTHSFFDQYNCSREGKKITKEDQNLFEIIDKELIDIEEEKRKCEERLAALEKKKIMFLNLKKQTSLNITKRFDFVQNIHENISELPCNLKKAVDELSIDLNGDYNKLIENQRKNWKEIAEIANEGDRIITNHCIPAIIPVRHEGDTPIKKNVKKNSFRVDSDTFLSISESEEDKENSNFSINSQITSSRLFEGSDEEV